MTSAENRIMVDRELAAAVGLKESIVISTFLLGPDEYERHGRASLGLSWLVGTADYLVTRFFPWMADTTLRKTVNVLRKYGLLYIANTYLKGKGNQENWYSVRHNILSAYLHLWHQHGCPTVSTNSDTYRTFEEQWYGKLIVNNVKTDRLRFYLSPAPESNTLYPDQSDANQLDIPRDIHLKPLHGWR